MYYMQINKNFVHQVGDQPRLYYDARLTSHQDPIVVHCHQQSFFLYNSHVPRFVSHEKYFEVVTLRPVLTAAIKHVNMKHRVQIAIRVVYSACTQEC